MPPVPASQIFGDGAADGAVQPAPYFDDMWSHFQGLSSVLARGAELHYIVGNSTFYGTVLPTEQIYEVMLKKLGFADVECRPIRKRNSKKELIEFDVTGRWCR